MESKLEQVSKPTLISGLFDREFKDNRTRYMVQCALKEKASAARVRTPCGTASSHYLLYRLHRQISIRPRV